jgi:hypothetical protein
MRFKFCISPKHNSHRRHGHGWNGVPAVAIQEKKFHWIAVRFVLAMTNQRLSKKD